MEAKLLALGYLTPHLKKQQTFMLTILVSKLVYSTSRCILAALFQETAYQGKNRCHLKCCLTRHVQPIHLNHPRKYGGWYTFSVLILREYRLVVYVCYVLSCNRDNQSMT